MVQRRAGILQGMLSFSLHSFLLTILLAATSRRDREVLAEIQRDMRIPGTHNHSLDVGAADFETGLSFDNGDEDWETDDDLEPEASGEILMRRSTTV